MYQNKGLIFAFEGLDGSGKETQTLLLEKRLRKLGIKVLRVEFPNYKTEYSVFVRRYLEGKFNDNINPYVVSTFFSLDRLGVYETLMRNYLDQGYVILCDRYVYSNLIYQGTKIDDIYDRQIFFDWVIDFEYIKCNLPRENMTFFMDVPVSVSLSFIKERKYRDIYESDELFLRKCYENCSYIVEKYGLFRVNCSSNNKLLSVVEINDILYEKILEILKI